MGAIHHLQSFTYSAYRTIPVLTVCMKDGESALDIDLFHRRVIAVAAAAFIQLGALVLSGVTWKAAVIVLPAAALLVWADMVRGYLVHKRHVAKTKAEISLAIKHFQEKKVTPEDKALFRKNSYAVIMLTEVAGINLNECDEEGNLLLEFPEDPFILYLLSSKNFDFHKHGWFEIAARTPNIEMLYKFKSLNQIPPGITYDKLYELACEAPTEEHCKVLVSIEAIDDLPADDRMRRNQAIQNFMQGFLTPEDKKLFREDIRAVRQLLLTLQLRNNENSGRISLNQFGEDDKPLLDFPEKVAIFTLLLNKGFDATKAGWTLTAVTHKNHAFQNAHTEYMQAKAKALQQTS